VVSSVYTYTHTGRKHMARSPASSNSPKIAPKSSPKPKKDEPFGSSPNRPSPQKLEIPKDQYDRLAFCVQLGLHFEDIAMLFGMSRQSLRRRLAEDEKMREVYREAKASAHAYVATKLYEHIHRGNLPAIIFYLKSQAGWHEKQVIEHTLLDQLEKDSDAWNDVIPSLTDGELEQLQTLLMNAEKRRSGQVQGKPN